MGEGVLDLVLDGVIVGDSVSSCESTTTTSQRSRNKYKRIGNKGAVLRVAPRVLEDGISTGLEGDVLWVGSLG